MRQTILVTLLALSAAGCSSSSNTSDTNTPAAACTSFAVASCNRIYSCTPSTPGTAASCATAVEADSNCSTASCGSQTFNSSAASQCLTDYENQPCGDVGNVAPASCNNVCQ